MTIVPVRFFIMYYIVGICTFSSQANRDSARTRVDTAIAGVTFTNVTTVFTPGVNNPTTVTITVSIQLDIDDSTVAAAAHKAIYDAIIASNRPTTCYLSFYRVSGSLMS